MSADVVVLAASSVVMFGYGPVFYAVARHRKRRELARTPEPRLHTEWSRLQEAVAQARADIAAGVVEGTPIYDRMVCEQIEKAEGWAS